MFALAVFWTLTALVAFGVAYVVGAPLRVSGARQMLAVLVGVPLISLGVYVYLGNPDTPDYPLDPRLSGTLEALPPAAILARLENRLRDHPDDIEGWRLLARLRVSVSQHVQAGDAWQRVLDLAPADAEAQLGLAQAFIEQNDGVVNEAAVGLLDGVLRVAPDNMVAQFWRAEAWAQQGDDSKARVLWRALRDKLPDAAPLGKALDARLAR